MKLQRIVYRDLLVAARELDRNPAFRATITSNMLIRPDVGGPQKTSLPHVEEYNRGLLEFLENRSYYMPSRERKPESAQAMVRDKFRQKEPRKHALDAALVALKALHDRVSYAVESGLIDEQSLSMGPLVAAPSSSSSPRKPRKKGKTKLLKELLAVQAKQETECDSNTGRASPVQVHPAETLSSGIFLLAHPMLTGIFNRSVIVLTEHSRKGTKGFIVNRPTQTPLMKAFKVHPRIMQAFGSSKVRKGGPLRTPHAEIIHSHEELGGERIITGNFATPSDENLFVGVDLESAAKAVESETVKQSEVVFINGLSSWIPGQLEGEMMRGTWVAVRAPLSLAVDGEKDLWSELMAGLGGEYEVFSRMPAIQDDEDDFDDDDLGNDDDDEDEDDRGNFHDDDA